MSTFTMTIEQASEENCKTLDYMMSTRRRAVGKGPAGQGPRLQSEYMSGGLEALAQAPGHCNCVTESYQLLLYPPRYPWKNTASDHDVVADQS